MTVDCEVIQDLIPLYQDGAVSPRTAEIVAEHLRGCDACRAYLEKSSLPPVPASTPPAPQNPEIVTYAQRVKSRRRTITVFVGCALVLLLLVIGAMGLVLYDLIYGGLPTISSDIRDYGNFESNKRYSNLEIFPRELPASRQNVQFYSFYQNTFLDPTYQIHLEYTLDEADYRAEVERLSKISVTSKGETHPIVYDTENFIGPAYVTIMANNLTYEYALLIEEERKIVYVFTQFVHRRDIKFDTRYLPKTFQSPSDPNVDTLGGYNIYYFRMEKIDGAYMEEKKWK